MPASSETGGRRGLLRISKLTKVALGSWALANPSFCIPSNRYGFNSERGESKATMRLFAARDLANVGYESAQSE